MDKLLQLIDDLIHLQTEDVLEPKNTHPFLRLGKRIKFLRQKQIHPHVHQPYPEAFLLVGFDLGVQVFQSAGEAAVDQILSHMLVCPLYC